MDIRDYPAAYLTDELESYGTSNHVLDKAAKEIESLRAENKAQLAELNAISEALGTSQGHSSVYWIERLKRIEAAAVTMLNNQTWNDDAWYNDMLALDAALKES